LVHLLSIEDMRRCGPDGWLLFYSFHTTMGVADADQEVAAPLRQEAERRAEEQLHRAPPRNRSNEDDDADDRGGKAFAPQRRSLFQCLRWPSNKGHGREHSPRRSHGESSRHGGRRHDRERSLSPATHRSRECSLDRFNLYFNHQEKADEVDGDENAKKKGPRRHCKPLHPSPWGKPGAGPARAVCTPPAGDELESRMPEEVSTFNPFDPMLQEAAISMNKVPTAGLGARSERMDVGNHLQVPEIEAAATQTMEGSASQLSDFIHEVMAQPTTTILPTLRKNAKQARASTAMRRSSRLASKSAKKGSKTRRTSCARSWTHSELQSVVKTPQRQRVHACVNFSKLPSPRSH
jgi:hypothetical protein